MLTVKRTVLALLTSSLFLFAAACGGNGVDPTPQDPATAQSPSSDSPSESTATATVAPPEEPRTIALPDETRALFEAWRIVQREYVDIDNIDPRVLSDGAIFGILDAMEESTLSIAQARALEYDLELEENYFSVPGGDELEEAYEVFAYAYTRPEDDRLDVYDLNIAAIKGMVGALADPIHRLPVP